VVALHRGEGLLGAQIGGDHRHDEGPMAHHEGAVGGEVALGAPHHEAEVAARLESSIESELLARLKSGTYNEIYNFPTKEYAKVLDATNKMTNKTSRPIRRYFFIAKLTKVIGLIRTNKGQL
jgi:hypothetical protein